MVDICGQSRTRRVGGERHRRVLGSALHHSLAGQKLTNTFDVGMFLELVKQPDVKLFSQSDGVLLFACLYFLFLLFITPGVISAYLEDRALATGEYFGASGTFFWAFVRLALWSLIPFIVVNLLYDGMDHLAEYIGDRAVADPGRLLHPHYRLHPGLVAICLGATIVDLAQVRAVSLNELKTRRDVGRSSGWPCDARGMSTGLHTDQRSYLDRNGNRAADLDQGSGSRRPAHVPAAGSDHAGPHRRPAVAEGMYHNVV